MKKRGFTLIELLVVVAIIGTLAAIVLASLSSARSRSREARLKAELRNFQNGLELYYLDHGEYPDAYWMLRSNLAAPAYEQFRNSMEPYFDVRSFEEKVERTGNFFYRLSYSKQYKLT